MNIRLIEVQDAENFLFLSQVIEESGMMLFEPGEKQLSVDEQKASIERILAVPNSALFVAEKGGDLAGYIAAFGGKVKRTSHSAYLVLGVHPDYYRQGIASKLFEKLFQWALQRGIKRLELTVIKYNEKAFSLYEKMGFSIEGEKVHSLYIDGEPVNEYYMYKLI
ncbi:GNAT family N-acetyltransferase [Metabacillus sp. GX 13764]|uniref:GNAT family N-acetyltransferase n=1 Tax=Metabacillus kandeliae TaxID=2900151 RepID=UPI001E60049A|nr:GNAT family N-acetyltransferase [Metabacillus kandeliae]MCD7034806.1 GNAT family N-acetyltransferase [Metabacillus kandeliae]